MPLILTLTHLRGMTPPETRRLSQGTLSIGRASNNDWVLADPDRHLSKTHCIVSVEGGRYIIADVSTNGVFINGAKQPTARDQRLELTDGDQFRLGDYSVTVAEAAGGGAGYGAASSGDAFGLDAPRGGGGYADPFSRPQNAPDPLGGAFDDPLAGDPLGHDMGGHDPLGGGLDDPFGNGPATVFHHPIVKPPPMQRMNDPFDFADEAKHTPIDADDDLFKGITPSDSWRGPSQADNVDAPKQAYIAPRPIPPVMSDFDFDDLLGDLPPGDFGSSPAAAPAPPPPRSVAQPPAARAVPPPPVAATPFDEGGDDPLDFIQPRHEPAPAPAPAPRQATIPPAAQQPRPARQQAPQAADGDLVRAFLEGAGIPSLNVGDQDPEALMRLSGQIFRTLVEGLQEVLMSRAAIKNEMRVEQTVIRATNNNALKFSVTVDKAVESMLLPSQAGYKPPLEAAKEAFADIKSHEMAVMAGVQTALIGLLKRFDPAMLEKRLQPGRLDSLLPAARKARFWELFCTTYKDIAREAEDDFQSVFGREFARAYDAQMRKL